MCGTLRSSTSSSPMLSLLLSCCCAVTASWLAVKQYLFGCLLTGSCDQGARTGLRRSMGHVRFPVVRISGRRSIGLVPKACDGWPRLQGNIALGNHPDIKAKDEVPCLMTDDCGMNRLLDSPSLILFNRDAIQLHCSVLTPYAMQSVPSVILVQLNPQDNAEIESSTRHNPSYFGHFFQPRPCPL